MKIKILRNLAGNYPPYKENEVRNVKDDLAAELLAAKLAEETDDELSKDVEKDPQPRLAHDSPNKAALTAQEMAAAKAGAGNKPATAEVDDPKHNPTVKGKSV